MSHRALVIDDDPLSREFLVEALRTSGYEVEEAATGEDGVKIGIRIEPNLVLTDLRLPGIDGIEVLRQIRDRHPDIPVIVLTAFGTIERAVEAMRAGAEDFLLKPVSPEQIEVVLARLTDRRRLIRENRVLKARLETGPERTNGILGRNRRFLEALKLASRVAETEATVLLRGESGTGKELVADLVHHESKRADGPFIRVNCAALTESLLTSELFGHEKGAFTGAHQRKEGRFELAVGGTLFLDEIGEMPMEVQGRLLRVLESGEFERVGGTRTLHSDARIVAATNRDLEVAIEQGRFREDLFYRLNVVPITLVPLRERLDDIPLLVNHFLRKSARDHGRPACRVSSEALEALRSCEWPGNVRELANTMERSTLVAKGEIVGLKDLGLPSRRPATESAMAVGMTLEEVERRVILGTLDSTGWNRTHAARILGVTARTLSNKLKVWRTRGLVSQESA